MRVLIILSFVLLTGCTTNRLHFASYSDVDELESLRNTDIAASVISVTGAESCGLSCSEFSKIVWHPAISSGRLQEGYSWVPIKDWFHFVQKALGSRSDQGREVSIQIDRVFLKTWSDPEYYACHVEITVSQGENEYKGKSVIKVKGAGQTIVGFNKVAMNQSALDAVALAIKAAYRDAMIDRT